MKPILILMPLILTVCSCEKATAPVEKIDQPALTHVVGTFTTDIEAVYSGEIQARREAPLGFRIGGKIIERLVDVGARVTAGQPLARLDPVDYALQVNAAQAQYQFAHADAERYRELRQKNFVSQSALDAKETALKLASAQAGLTENQSDYTTLNASQTGVITEILAEVGQVVNPGQPVMQLAQDGSREVVIAIPESQYADLKIGTKADINLWSSNSESIHFKGYLREIAPAADSASRTYTGRVALQGRDTEAALGMTAQLKFNTHGKSDKLIVPLTALFQQGELSAVWIVADDHSIKLRPVLVAAYREKGAVIAAGLTPGERIVSAGVHKLNPGEKIRVIEGEFADGIKQ